MAQKKYIVFSELSHDGQMKTDVPLVFRADLIHAIVGKTFGRYGAADSAGFCELVTLTEYPRDPKEPVSEDERHQDKALGVRWRCWGESESMKLKSKTRQDERLLDKYYR